LARASLSANLEGSQLCRSPLGSTYGQGRRLARGIEAVLLCKDDCGKGIFRANSNTKNTPVEEDPTKYAHIIIYARGSLGHAEGPKDDGDQFESIELTSVQSIGEVAEEELSDQ
jgi:hypothetical protein